MRAAWLLLLCACSSGAAPAVASPAIADTYPLAKLDDRALCDRLLARKPDEFRVIVDREPKLRRNVIVSDLHLGPGTGDPRFTGIEDFYSDAEWGQFLDAQTAPTDLIIDGDFIEFWQIAAALHALPKPDPNATGITLAEDQDFGVAAIELVIAAHPSVFRDLGRFLARGDRRVIIVPGNHDADILWPKVQLRIARAIAPPDPNALIFVNGAAYEHAGVHVEHGHAFDAANQFATGYAPFGRDRDGRCRLQASWGEIFVDQFYTETERQIPFIDNLYPESAAVLWELREDPRGVANGVGAGIRFLELLRSAETSALNRDAAKAALQSLFGTPDTALPDVIDQLTNQLAHGDSGAKAIVGALWELVEDPQLASLWSAVIAAARALPDFPAAFDELRKVDPDALAHLRDRAFGDVEETAAARLLGGPNDIRDVVLAHTHTVGGRMAPISANGRSGFFANTGSWISVASVAELVARGVTWDKLSLADRAMFPSKRTAVVIDYANGQPQPPVVLNASR
jgi:UDP-2,3-diacylglucosamine pyrophosphatase LpxH